MPHALMAIRATHLIFAAPEFAAMVHSALILVALFEPSMKVTKSVYASRMPAQRMIALSDITPITFTTNFSSGAQFRFRFR